MDVIVAFRGKQHAISLPSNPSMTDLAIALQQQLLVSLETIKLARPGRPGAFLKPAEMPDQRLHEAGILPTARLSLFASLASEVEQVRSSRELPGLANFDHDLRRSARRQRGSRPGTLKLPTGPHTFQRYEAWQLPMLIPAPAEALKLLHRLAADPGIVGIMQKHRWTVGTLSEMPPEGKVGVSPVCILGVNINAGQEISLRLRTDDLKGFRRYDRIRETLVHELAHMVFGEHDNNFKELNSQLLRECGALDWTRAGTLPGAGDFFEPEPMDVEEAVPQAHTLRQPGSQAGLSPASARAAAADAAARRAAEAAQEPGPASTLPAVVPPLLAAAEPTDASAAAPAPPLASPAAALAVQAPDGPRGVPAQALTASTLPEREVSMDPDQDVEGLGHRNDSTEAAEDEMRHLGLPSRPPSPLHTSEQARADSQDRQAGAPAAGASSAPSQLRSSAQASAGPQGSIGPALAPGPSPAARGATPGSSQKSSQTEYACPQDAHAMEWQQAGQAEPAAPQQQPTEAPARQQPDPHEAAVPSSATIEHAPKHDPWMGTGDTAAAAAAQAGAARQQGAAQAAATLADRGPDDAAAQAAVARQQDEADQAAAMMAALPQDDPAVERYRQVQAAAQQLVREAGHAAPTALQTLSRLLQDGGDTALWAMQNILDHPTEAKYRRVRLANPTYSARAGQFPSSRELLRLAGFSVDTDDSLNLTRNDPGLLWLALSVLRGCGQPPQT